MITTPRTTSPLRRVIATAALGLSVALGASLALSLSGDVARAEAAEVAPATAPAVIFEPLALGHLDNIAKNEHAAVANAVDSKMRKELTADGIAKGWAQYEQTHGSYKSHGRPKVIPHGELTVVEVPLDMERQKGQFRIIFNNGDGLIAGVYFLN
jgi:hypothetical protein